MLLRELLSRQKENGAIAIKQGEQTITYSEWHKASKMLEQNILSVLSDDSLNIAVLLPNSIKYAVAYFAVQYANRILVPIDTHAKAFELLSTLEYCESDLLITSAEYLPLARQATENYRYKIYILDIDSGEMTVVNADKKSVIKTKYLSQTGHDNDVAIMLHTSGTTSNPKRVMLTHCNLISNVESNIESLQLTHQDKVLIAMPMFFGYCNTAQFLTHLYLAAPMVILDTMFLPKQFFQTVESEKITNFTGVPSMLLMLLDYRYSNKYDYSSLRYICFGGGKMPIGKLKMLIEKYPTVGFVQTYGQTECSPRVTALLPQYALSKLGSVGTPIPHVQVQVVDTNGHSLSANETGEILVKGKNTMKGYYKQPEITRKTIQDGWVHTGDLGYIDSDGFLYLNGRIRNMVISGGLNIYPEEIEQVLLQHAYIEDACVIGEEHERLGEVPVAKVILKAPIGIKELMRYCTSQLSDYKVPVRFEIVNELPKTYNGKIKRY